MSSPTNTLLMPHITMTIFMLIIWLATVCCSCTGTQEHVSLLGFTLELGAMGFHLLHLSRDHLLQLRPHLEARVRSTCQEIRSTW